MSSDTPVAPWRQRAPKGLSQEEVHSWCNLSGLEENKIELELRSEGKSEFKTDKTTSVNNNKSFMNHLERLCWACLDDTVAGTLGRYSTKGWESRWTKSYSHQLPSALGKLVTWTNWDWTASDLTKQKSSKACPQCEGVSALFHSLPSDCNSSLCPVPPNLYTQIVPSGGVNFIYIEFNYFLIKWPTTQPNIYFFIYTQLSMI